MNLYPPSFFDALEHSARPAAKAILAEAHRASPFESICDVGCGRGTWLFEASKLGATKLVGWDGPWVPALPIGQLDHEIVKGATIELNYQNLENPVRHSERFDVALCLEVAEHLSAARAPGLVEDLCLLSDRVIFSGATVGQGGEGHINEQPHSYWIHLFQRQGYKPDFSLRHKVAPNKAISWWYTQNLMEFRR